MYLNYTKDDLFNMYFPQLAVSKNNEKKQRETSFDVVMKRPGIMGFTVLIFKQPTSPIKKCMTQGIDLVHR